MPVDPEILRNLAARRLGIQDESRVARQRTEQNYQTDTSRLGQLQTDTFKNINDQLGSQGLFHSGIRQKEQGTAAQGFGNQLSDLGMGRTRGLEDIQRNETGMLQQLLGEEQSAQAQAARADEQERLLQELTRAQAEAAQAQIQQYQQPAYQAYQQPRYQAPAPEPYYQPIPTSPEQLGQEFVNLWNNTTQEVRNNVTRDYGETFWSMSPDDIRNFLMANQMNYWDDPNFINYIAGG